MARRPGSRLAAWDLPVGLWAVRPAGLAGGDPGARGRVQTLWVPAPPFVCVTEGAVRQEPDVLGLRRAWSLVCR